MRSIKVDMEHRSLTKVATILSLLVTFVLIVVKLFAYLKTDSISMYSSLFDSLLDMVTSTINFLAVVYAMRPPDETHKFGHDKAEDVATFAQASFIGASGVFISVSAINRLFNPIQVHHGSIGIGVMIFSIIALTSLLLFQRHVTKKTGSSVVEVDALNYAGDLLTNVAIIASIVMSDFLGWTLADPIFAIAIALYLFISGCRIGYNAFNKLVDSEMPHEKRKEISKTAKNHPNIIDIKHLRTRASGLKLFIQFHIEVGKNTTVSEAKAISEEVKIDILQQFPNAEVTISALPSVSS